MPGTSECTYAGIKVVHCTSALVYGPNYFWSRYPLERSRLFNLKNLLTPGSWFAYFITIIFVIISLKLSCYFGVKLGLNTVTEEIALVPFRLTKHIFLTLCEPTSGDIVKLRSRSKVYLKSLRDLDLELLAIIAMYPPT